ncbi:A disintegrin and metalloproteinase with thrombospondin motifs 4-like isoform X2 [Ostrea edulis]|uniref:A disintegrin and metalloproteinase with thrombospondin motifs 4-like isoform X2 n=1 Tax=Ostrea edulis TaxID=37623 RepID=UPI002095031E|nr:A disintegrin and metalloproteinase with thrombospondin motifs 4-like isoform X2 [Ostrea edulis]
MDKVTILRIVIFSILIAYISQTDGDTKGYRRIQVYEMSSFCCPGYYGKDCKTVDGGWTDFGTFTNWTSCNVTCGGGTTTRKQVRTCTNPAPVHGGKNCSGPRVKIEKKDCNLNPCPDKITTTTAEPKCKHGEYRADLDHCKNYFFCNSGTEIKASCQTGTFWDEVKLNCLHIDKVDCKKRPTS